MLTSPSVEADLPAVGAPPSEVIQRCIGEADKSWLDVEGAAVSFMMCEAACGSSFRLHHLGSRKVPYEALSFSASGCIPASKNVFAYLPA